jgi:hypothetical protein
LYHPHGNNTWYTIDSEQSGNRLHEDDFLVIGKIKTSDLAHINKSGTFLQAPKHPDSIVAPESLGNYPPIGITAGGILFADIYLNQYNHTANSGEIQFINRRNNPNTEFVFIHPGQPIRRDEDGNITGDSDSIRYTVNGAAGVLTSLEQFPGSRYITFIGGDKEDRTFTFDYRTICFQLEMLQQNQENGLDNQK